MCSCYLSYFACPLQARYEHQCPPQEAQESADAFLRSLAADITGLRLETEGLASRERRLLSILQMQQSHLGALHRHEVSLVKPAGPPISCAC